MTSETAKSAALVMAGSRGIGLACAEELSRRGHPVAICARDAAGVEASAESIRSRGGQAVGLVADVSRPDELVSAIADAANQLGPIGVLVTNSGGPPAGGFLVVTMEQWDAAYQLTLRSVVVAIREVLPGMRERRDGRIVVIGSSSVRRPIPGLVLSNAYRPALMGLVVDLSGSLARDGITVNLVSPGRVDTDRVRELDAMASIAQDISEEQVREHSFQKIPMGRYGRPEELAAAVGFFASQEASYITGQVLLVDGGMASVL